LNDEPVVACPPTAGYRLRKLVRRHKTAIATSAVVAAALIAGTVVSTWQAIRATSAAERAIASETELRKSQRELQERSRVATAKVTKALNEAKLHEGRADVAELDEQVTELELAIKSAERARDLTRQGDVEDTVRENVDRLLRGLTERAATAQKQAEQARADRAFKIELETNPPLPGRPRRAARAHASY
jgi:uncharacterized protein HemX